MQKSVTLAKKIVKDFKKDWSSEIEDSGLHKVFSPVTDSIKSIEDRNRVVSFIIYSFSPDSGWLDLNKDRLENLKQIIEFLGADEKSKLFSDIINKSNEAVSEATLYFIQELKDWRWGAIYDLLYSSSKLASYAMEDFNKEKQQKKKPKKDEEEQPATFTELDAEAITKIHKQKSELQDLSIKKRRDAQALMEEIQKEFVKTDKATQSDYGFKFTDTAENNDPISWRGFVKNILPDKVSRNHVVQRVTKERAAT